MKQMKPRLLFLTSRNPYDGISGDRLRARKLIEQLSRNFSVTVWCTSKTFTISNVPDEVSIQAFPPKPSETIRNLLRACLQQNIPFQVALHESSTLHSACRLGHSDFDVVFSHLIRTATYLKHFRIQRVLDYCDAISENATQTAANARLWSAWGLINRLEAPRAQRYEKQLRTAIDLAIVASQRDATLIGLEDIRTTIVPQGVDLRTGRKNPTPPTSSKSTALFIGTMDYFPNLDAALWFADNVLPLIPNLALRIVGPISEKNRLKLEAKPRVQVMGRVAELSEVAYGCDIGVAPMRVATGIQNKILDYLSLGLPVLATTKAIQGLPVGPEAAGIIVVDTPEQWSQQAINILQTPSLLQTLSSRGTRYVREWHDWNRIGDRLLAAMDETSAIRKLQSLV